MTFVRRRWIRYALVIVAAVMAFLPVSAASAAPSHSSSDPKPTVVIVHGAFADASGWNTTIGTLQQLGFPVIAVANPLRGLTSDSDYVRSVLQTIQGPIVLVGHSYGGAVISNAARGVPNVKALVFVAAFALDEGESLATTPDPQQFPGGQVTPDTTIARQVPNAAAPGGVDVELTIKPEDFQRVFAADVPKFRTNIMAATQRPFAVTAIVQPSGPPAWKTIPSWDLITLDDNAIPPAGQQFMAQRAHAHIETVHSSHAVMVSHPEAVTRITLEAARSI
jgi:pimeloyl-ACP methyl ester carboxylesterase